MPFVANEHIRYDGLLICGLKYTFFLSFLLTCRHLSYVYCTECPADFTNISSVNGCYKVVTHDLTWSAAGLECRSLHKDAHLLIINDAQEQAAVAKMLKSIKSESSFLIFSLSWFNSLT